MSELHKLLLSSYEGDSLAIIALVEKFQPILKKYAYMLNYEDAYYDLLVKLIELIKSPNLQGINSPEDASILLYIKKSIYHSFIALSKSQEKTSKTDSLTLSEYNDDTANYILNMDKLCSTNDDYTQIEYDFLYKVLTKYEAEIIIYHFYLKYTVKEIADLYGVSMPAITQAKKNAIKKLKQFYIKSKLR